MQFSRYLKIYGCTAPEGCSLLFSTLTGSLAYVPDEVVRAVRAGEPIPLGQEESLRELGMVVDDLEEERRGVSGFFEEFDRVHGALQASIILNLRCNFACVYCYEGTQKSNRVMDAETADRAIAFLKSRFGEGKEELILYFYGGEPLLDPATIKRFAGELKPFAEGRGAKFKFNLVTNGSLLTRQLVEELLPFGLAGAKVTLDGPRENHDRFRPFRNGTGSFDRIVENVKSCADLVRISISGNFDRDNYRLFPEMIGALAASGLGPEKIRSMFFGPIQQVNDEFSTPEHLGGCVSLDEPWLTDATLALRRAVLEGGYETTALLPSPCMVDIRDALTIHVDGTLTKCPALIGHGQFVAGDLEKGFGDFAESYNLGSWKREAACAECAYLPLCFGGCRMMLYQRSGSVAGVDCRRGHYDSVLEALIKQDIELSSLP